MYKGRLEMQELMRTVLPPLEVNSLATASPLTSLFLLTVQVLDEDLSILKRHPETVLSHSQFYGSKHNFIELVFNNEIQFGL
jgi:hypothetical protein